jgi:hypothetical protein
MVRVCLFGKGATWSVSVYSEKEPHGHSHSVCQCDNGSFDCCLKGLRQTGQRLSIWRRGYSGPVKNSAAGRRCGCLAQRHGA